MMEILRKYLVTNKNFSGLIFLPYWILIVPRILDSELFSWFKLLTLFGLFIVSSIFFVKYTFRKSLLGQVVNAVLFSILLVFFYGQIMYDFVQPLLASYFDLELRGRVLLPLIFLLIFASKIYLTCKIKIFHLWLNRVFLVFTLVLLGESILGIFIKEKFQPNRLQLYSPDNQLISHKSSKKPVLLIILDEYQSPESLSNLIGATRASELKNYLEVSGWTTKPEFPTLEAGTIHSISSLFNFNLSDNSSNYGNNSVFFADSVLRSARLIKYLNKQNIEFYNYSFFKVGGKSEWFKLYPLPKTFIELFVQLTLYPKADIATLGFVPSKASNSYNPSSEYNQKLLLQTKSILNSKPKEAFYYIHLYMPHSPVIFGTEINSLNYDVTNYARYWLFVNQKMATLLQNASYKNKFRIIITGDHGYRGDKNINPHNTFAAFYGFQKNEIDQLKSVQDIGKLIARNF